MVCNNTNVVLFRGTFFFSPSLLFLPILQNCTHTNPTVPMQSILYSAAWEKCDVGECKKPHGNRELHTCERNPCTVLQLHCTANALLCGRWAEGRGRAISLFLFRCSQNRAFTVYERTHAYTPMTVLPATAVIRRHRERGGGVCGFGGRRANRRYRAVGWENLTRRSKQ